MGSGGRPQREPVKFVKHGQVGPFNIFGSGFHGHLDILSKHDTVSAKSADKGPNHIMGWEPSLKVGIQARAHQLSIGMLGCKVFTSQQVQPFPLARRM